jgi:hypothetical protein
MDILLSYNIVSFSLTKNNRIFVFFNKIAHKNSAQKPRIFVQSASLGLFGFKSGKTPSYFDPDITEKNPGGWAEKERR